MNIPEYEVSEWISELKPYQRSSIELLLSENNPQDAVKLWLSADGPSATAKFGGQKFSPEPFFDRFFAEFKKFVCGDEAYSELRAQLDQEAPVAKAVYISVIAGGIASTLGFAASLLAPAVAVMLSSVGRMGVEAWCSVN